MSHLTAPHRHAVWVLAIIAGLLAALVAAPGARATGTGTDWTSRTPAVSATWLAVTYGEGLFVATGGAVMTSPDGVTWTQRTAPAASWFGAAYGNGTFVAVGPSGKVMSSPDGVTWTLQTPAAAATYGWYSVTFGNGKFVAVASDGTTGGVGGVMTSTDGETWTSHDAPSANQWRGVTYGGGLYVAVAQTGSSDGTGRVMTSSDGSSWTARDAAAGDPWFSVTYGDGRFAAVARDGHAMTSANGVTWTDRATVAGSWRSVTYGDGTFVAVSNDDSNPQVMTSTDGATWATSAAASNDLWFAVTYDGGMFVSVAQGGAGDRVMTSGTYSPSPDPGPDPSPSDSSSGSVTPATAEFRFLLPDGTECSAISPMTVTIGRTVTLPGVDANCRTTPDATVAGWTIPTPPGSTEYGSPSTPFLPGQPVVAVDSQRFTVVPREAVLALRTDANIAAEDSCLTAERTVVQVAQRTQESWIPRANVDLARLPSTAACAPAGGLRLLGWSTQPQSGGTVLAPGAAVPQEWADDLANTHHLYAIWGAGPATG